MTVKVKEFCVVQNMESELKLMHVTLAGTWPIVSHSGREFRHYQWFSDLNKLW